MTKTSIHSVRGKIAPAKVVGEIEVGRNIQPDDGKDPAAVALGRKGGLKGGVARAASLTKEQRSAIAKKAAISRWKATERREAEVFPQKKRGRKVLSVDSH
jgi:hypothetical protein